MFFVVELNHKRAQNVSQSSKVPFIILLILFFQRYGHEGHKVSRRTQRRDVFKRIVERRIHKYFSVLDVALTVFCGLNFTAVRKYS